MPTYLVHGFRWSRPLIRIYIVKWDIIDAAPEWIMMPSSAIALTNAFYSQYDFIPPCQPPPRVVSMSLPDTPISPSFLIPENPNHDESEEEGKDVTAQVGKEFNDWSTVKFLEQYDSNDESTASQPYAYVADYIVPVALSVDIENEKMLYENWQKHARWQAVSTPRLALQRQVEERPENKTWIAKLQNEIQGGAKVGWYIVVCDPAGRAVNLSDQDSVSEEEAEEILKVPEVSRTPKNVGLKGFLTLRSKRNLRNKT